MNVHGSPLSEKPDNAHEIGRYLADKTTTAETPGNIEGESRRRHFADREESTLVVIHQGRIGEDTQEGYTPDASRDAIRPGFRGRLSCYTWTWFTMTMATGGIANVLHTSTVVRSISNLSLTPCQVPYRSDGLRIVGTIIFLSNIALFLMNCVLIILRFRLNPGSLKASFLSESESLFIPACVCVLRI